MGSHSVLFCIVISRNASSSYSDLHINDYELAAFRDDQPVRLLLDFGLSITASGLECGVSPGGCWVLICEVRSGGMDLKGFFVFATSCFAASLVHSRGGMPLFKMPVV